MSKEETDIAYLRNTICISIIKYHMDLIISNMQISVDLLRDQVHLLTSLNDGRLTTPISYSGRITSLNKKETSFKITKDLSTTDY